MTAATLLNYTPQKRLGWKTPYEVVTGEKRNIGNLAVIGSRSYVYNKRIARGDKLEDRTIVGYLVGFEGSNIYRIWLPKNKRIIRVRDVRFIQSILYKDDQQEDFTAATTQELQLLALPDLPSSEEVGIEELMPSETTPEINEAASEKAIKHTDKPSEDPGPYLTLEPSSRGTTLEPESSEAIILAEDLVSN